MFINPFEPEQIHINNSIKCISNSYDSRNDCIFATSMTSKGNTYLGILARLSNNFMHQKLHPHEMLEKNRLEYLSQNINQVGHQLSPILTTYSYNEEIDTLLKNIVGSEPDSIRFKTQELTIRLWEINKKSIFKKVNKNIENLSIADGHHRTSSIISLRKDICAHIVSEKYLQSYPILRVYHTEENFRLAIKFLSKNFYFEEILFSQIACAVQNSCFVVGYKGNFFRIYSKSHKAILKIFNNYIQNDSETKLIYTNTRLDFSYFLEASIINNNFLLIPSINVTKYIIDSKSVLPPRSSWIEPKIGPGFLSMDLDIQKQQGLYFL